MKFLPTIYATLNGLFECHLTFSDGRLIDAQGNAFDPTRFKIHAQPNLIPLISAAYFDAVMESSPWSRFADDESCAKRVVMGGIRGNNAEGTWSMATTFYIFSDESVSCGGWQGMTLFSPIEEEKQHPSATTCVWGVSSDSTDKDRAIITAWLDSYGSKHDINPSQSDAVAQAERKKEALFAEFKAEVDAQKELKFRPQRQDATPPHAVAIEPTIDQCKITRATEKGSIGSVFRIRATGFSICGDWSPGFGFEELLSKHGCTISYSCPALSDGYIGSFAAPINEIRYTLPDGEVRYAYVLASVGIDDWQEEIWTSDIRLSAAAAADTILLARDIAFGK